MWLVMWPSAWVPTGEFTHGCSPSTVKTGKKALLRAFFKVFCKKSAIFVQFLENLNPRTFYAILPKNQEKRAFFLVFLKKTAIFVQFL